MTPFSDWLRALKAPLSSANYDNENLDFIWFQYRRAWLVTMEEKRFGAQPSEAQQDTHRIVSQMLERGSQLPVKTMRGLRHVEYRGHYLIVFEKTTPDDSAWILINGKEATKDDLLYLLGHGRLPIDTDLAQMPISVRA